MRKSTRSRPFLDYLRYIACVGVSCPDRTRWSTADSCIIEALARHVRCSPGLISECEPLSDPVFDGYVLWLARGQEAVQTWGWCSRCSPFERVINMLPCSRVTVSQQFLKLRDFSALAPNGRRLSPALMIPPPGGQNRKNEGGQPMECSFLSRFKMLVT